MAVASAGRIARKNVRIIFQKNTVYSDRYKNRMQQWTDYFTCFAYGDTYTIHEDGDEVITEEKSVTFETRWCPELDIVTSTEYRILLDGQAYNILSIDPMNYQRRSIRFYCRKEKR